ncbi:CcmD family protein [Dyadobacter jejuensis]|nr:CcmD family protein [Dyadobacter jejuensis]
MKRLTTLFSFLLLMAITVSAQTPDSSVEMATRLRQDGKIWVVVAVIAVVFIGIIANLLRLEMKVRKMEKELNIK